MNTQLNVLIRVIVKLDVLLFLCFSFALFVVNSPVGLPWAYAQLFWPELGLTPVFPVRRR